MKLYIKVVIAIFISIYSYHSLAETSQVEKSRSRVEDLFLWKVSDTLSLDSKEEAEFSRIMKEVREERLSIDKKIKDVLKKLENNSDSKQQSSLVEDYKNLLKVYSGIHTKEVEQLEKLFGTARLGKYLVLKEQLLTKLKGALAESGKGNSTRNKSQTPKIVHEE